ncbi:YkvA family protein [Longispora sp. K20-0274]|uniref:YkvA family protein n=1 Tax=Longispora sp. K20-0274 TaxID=3088255 RepID=UPI00399AB5B8
MPGFQEASVNPTVKAVLIVALVLVLVALLAVTIVLAVKLFRLASVVRDAKMPVSGKFAFWAALVYAVFPIDLLPDPVYLDDIGVLLGAVTYIGHLARKNGILPDRGARAIDEP